jgi:hypothetical protein
VPEHLLKFTAEFSDASVFELQLQFECAVFHDPRFLAPRRKSRDAARLGSLLPRSGFGGGRLPVRERSSPPDPLRRLTLGAFISQAIEGCL